MRTAMFIGGVVTLVVCGLADASAQTPRRWAAFDPNSEAGSSIAWSTTEDDAKAKAIQVCKRNSKTCAEGPATTTDMMDVLAVACCEKPRRSCAGSFRSSRLKARDGSIEILTKAGYSTCSVRSYMQASTGKKLGNDLAQKDIHDHYAQGLEHYNKNEHGLAIAAFTKALELEPRNSHVFRIRGKSYRSNDQPDLAIADFTSAVQIDSQDADSYYMRGASHIDKSELDEAFRDFSRAIDLDQRFEYPLNGRGNVYRRKGQPDLAIAEYTRSVTIQPKFAVAYNNRGDAHRDRADFDSALRDYQKAVELEPKNSGYIADIGYAKFYKGDFKGAALDFLKALELRDNSYLMLFRFLALARAGENAGPELEANAGRLKSKSWPYAAIEMLAGKRSPEATLPVATKPNEICEAQFYIGEWHLLRGDKETATKMLEAAAGSCKADFAERHGALAELKRIRQ